VTWRDANQDRTCEASEVSSLASLGIERLDLRAQVLPPRTGSFEGLVSAFTFGTEKKRGRLVDVFLARM
jgi:hypothetical protein